MQQQQQLQQQPAPPPPPVTYVDFVPSPINSGGSGSFGITIYNPQYERFDVIVQSANIWLNANPAYTVITCESAEAKIGAASRLTNDISTWTESGKMATYFIRFLRLWLRLRGPGDKQGPSQIGYLNVVPGCIDNGSTFSLPQFESFGQTVGRINDMFRAQPLPGRIITVETQDFKFSNWSGSADPDCTVWRESGKYSEYFLNLIRVFYEVGPPTVEQIGTIDFVPEMLSTGGMMRMGEFEPYHSLTGKAHAWMQQNASMNVVNVQSVDYKLDSDWNGSAALDTHRTLFRESGRFATFYVRILRVCFTTGGPTSGRPFNLTYRSFVPCQVSTGSWAALAQYESLSQTMQRAQAWLNLTGVTPVSAETVPVKIFLGNGAHQINEMSASERTYTRNSGRFREAYIYVLRLYFDGYYQEPPPEQLPPLPMIQQSPSPSCNIL